MDAFSKGMERRRHLGKWYATFFFEMESRRLRRYEQRIFDYFEEKLIISEQDKNFIAHPNRSKIVAVPNGIDRSFFEDLPITPTYDLVFVGNLSYAPNIEAVLYLKDSILPLVKDCSLLVSGAQPSKSLQIACEEAPNITLQGWVNDIRESYKSGAVFVAPMMIGTGMQNKLLEAMALGIPCITTSLANNAIGAANGETILVAETAEQFKDAINLLRSDSALYHRISTQAKQFVQDHFQWNQSTRIIQGFIDKLTDR
jgi:glycosyltransferase involved in cell wall biosynthesis